MTDEKISDDGKCETLFIEGIAGMQMRDGVAHINLTRRVFPAPNSEAFAGVGDDGNLS